MAPTYSDDCAEVDWAALKAGLAADGFDSGRTPDESRRSHLASHAVVFARADGEIIGNGRVLSDGVGNAYLMDIWTATRHRRNGIGSEIVRRLLETVPGQHVALFTDHSEHFYERLGFRPEVGGMSMVVGSWLGR